MLRLPFALNLTTSIFLISTVVSKTKNSKTKTEAQSTQNSKTKHPKLENEAPKSRNRSVLYKHETNANTAGIKHDNEFSCSPP